MRDLVQEAGNKEVNKMEEEKRIEARLEAYDRRPVQCIPAIDTSAADATPTHEEAQKGRSELRRKILANID
jgi:hypothetical protein